MSFSLFDDLCSTVGELVLLGARVPLAELEDLLQVVDDLHGLGILMAVGAKEVIHMNAKDSQQLGIILDPPVVGQKKAAVQRMLEDCSIAPISKILETASSNQRPSGHPLSRT